MKPVRVAVIGGGNMGANHLRKYAQMKEVELVAVADPNHAIKKLADEHGVAYYEDFNVMLNSEDLHAVSVVVPTQLHHTIARTVLKRGVHCLVEKPIASTIDQAIELAQIAKENKLIFTVGHVEHYNPMITKLKGLVDDGVVGRVTSIVCRRVGGFPPLEPTTDAIIDLAVHDVGVMNMLLNGRPRRVDSHTSRTHHSNKADAAELLLDYGEASGFVQVNWTTPIKVRNITITGSKGYIEANYLTQEIDIYESNIQRQTSEDFKTFIGQVGEMNYHTVKVDFEEPLLIELQRFVKHIINNKDTSYIVSPNEAIAALQPTLEASIRSTIL